MADSLIIPRPMLTSMTGDVNLPLGSTPYDQRASNTPTKFPDEIPLRKLDRKSYDYEQNANLWAELALLYTGGWEIRSQATRFLWQRHKEPQDVYQSRITRFIYDNKIETVLGWYTSYLFRREPEVDIIDKVNRRPLVDTTVTKIKSVQSGDLKLGEPPDNPGGTGRETSATNTSGGTPGNSEEGPTINTANDEAGRFYTEFRGNVDRARTSLTSFFSRAMTHLLLNGRVFILTDVEPTSTQALNRQQSEKMGANRPYLVIYSSSDVINYRTDKEGNMVWAVVKGGRVEQESAFDDPEVVDQWWIYDQTSWALYEHRRPTSPNAQSQSQPQDGSIKQALLVNSGLHALHHVGRCPLRRYDSPDGLWLGKRAYLPALSHLNEDNALQWLLAQTNLAVPVITGAGAESGGTGETSGVQYYSEIYAIKLPAGAKFEWSSPDGHAAALSMQRIEKIVEEIYRLMYLQDQGRPSSTISSQRSGAAMMIEKMPGREVAESLGRFLRDMMTKAYQDVIAVRRETDAVQVSIRGFSFLENYVGLTIEDAERIKALGMPSGTVIRYVFKQIARLYMQDAPSHLMDLAIAEIDEWLTNKTILEFAQSTFQPETQQTAGASLKVPPVPARVQLAEAEG